MRELYFLAMDIPLTLTSTHPVGSVLEERRSSPGLLLALLGHVAMRRLRDAHARHGLTPRQFYLLGLLHAHGPTGQRELGSMMGTDPSVLVTMLNPLEDEGFVSRERDAQDRRCHLVVLTPAGEAKLIAAAQAQEAAEDELLGVLDGERREQLLTLLMALQEGLAGPDGGPGCAAAAPGERHPFEGDHLTECNNRSQT